MRKRRDVTPIHIAKLLSLPPSSLIETWAQRVMASAFPSFVVCSARRERGLVCCALS